MKSTRKYDELRKRAKQRAQKAQRAPKVQATVNCNATGRSRRRKSTSTTTSVSVSCCVSKGAQIDVKLGKVSKRRSKYTQEERERRRLERLKKNREAAQESRNRKKKQMEDLEGQVEHLSNENTQLKAQVHELRELQSQLPAEQRRIYDENQELRRRIERLEAENSRLKEQGHHSKPQQATTTPPPPPPPVSQKQPQVSPQLSLKPIPQPTSRPLPSPRPTEQKEPALQFLNDTCQQSNCLITTNNSSRKRDHNSISGNDTLIEMFTGASGLPTDDKTAKHAPFKGSKCTSTTLSRPLVDDFVPPPLPSSSFGVLRGSGEVWDFYAQKESAWMGSTLFEDDVSKFVPGSTEGIPSLLTGNEDYEEISFFG